MSDNLKTLALAARDAHVAFADPNGSSGQLYADMLAAKAELCRACDPQTILALVAERDALRERLEMDHVYRPDENGELQRVRADCDIPDGIECRDETIKAQDAMLDRLRAENDRLRKALTTSRDQVHCLLNREHCMPDDQARQTHALLFTIDTALAKGATT